MGYVLAGRPGEPRACARCSCTPWGAGAWPAPPWPTWPGRRCRPGSSWRPSRARACRAAAGNRAPGSAGHRPRPAAARGRAADVLPRRDRRWWPAWAPPRSAGTRSRSSCSSSWCCARRLRHDDRLAALDADLARLPGVLVAFSGGVDSGMLLAAAVRALGAGRVVAGRRRLSPSLPGPPSVRPRPRSPPRSGSATSSPRRTSSTAPDTSPTPATAAPSARPS